MRTPSFWHTGPRVKFHLLKGDSVEAHPLIEHAIAVLRTGSVVNLPWCPRVLCLGPGAARRVERGAEPAPGRRATRRAPRHKGISLRVTAGSTARWVVPVCYSASSTRRGTSATARSNPISLSPGSRPCAAPARRHRDPSRPVLSQSGKARYREALALAEPRGMRPLIAHCHLGLGKLLPAHGTAAGSEKTPHDRDDNVPRDGHAVLAGAGRGRDAEVGMRVASWHGTASGAHGGTRGYGGARGGPLARRPRGARGSHMTGAHVLRRSGRPPRTSAVGQVLDSPSPSN